jgi:hypothetical protein
MNAPLSNLTGKLLPELTAQNNPLADIDWNAAWDTDAAAHMFARVRELCGAHCGPPVLTPR